MTTKTKAKPRKCSPNPYVVYAYFPARLAFTPAGDAKEKFLHSLARECGGKEEGSGTGGAFRDVSFGFKTRQDAKRFLGKLAKHKIKRGSIVDQTKPPYCD